MRKFTNLLLGVAMLMAATATHAATTKNTSTEPALSQFVTGIPEVVSLSGKMVDGKLVINKKPGYVYQPYTFYVVFVWQTAAGGYDLRLQEAKYDPVYSIIATSVPVAITANITGTTYGPSGGTINTNVTIPANTYNGVVDLGVYPSSGDPTLTTNSVSPGTVNVSGKIWNVVNIQFPADIHP